MNIFKINDQEGEFVDCLQHAMQVVCNLSFEKSTLTKWQYYANERNIIPIVIITMPHDVQLLFETIGLSLHDRFIFNDCLVSGRTSPLIIQITTLAL